MTTNKKSVIAVLIIVVGLASYFGYKNNLSEGIDNTVVQKVEVEQEQKITLIGTVKQLNNNSDPAKYSYELTLNSPFYDELQATGQPYVSKMPILSRDKALQESMGGYVGKEVAAKGLIEFGLAESRFLNVTAIVDMSSWNTYTNETYGYNLKFPDTYEVSPQTEKQKSQLGVDNNIGIINKSDPNGDNVIVVNVTTDKSDISLQEYENKYLKNTDYPMISGKFNGYDSLSSRGVMQNGKVVQNVFIKQNQYIYHIVIFSAASLEKEIGDIVATFRFTNGNTSPNYVSAMSILQNVPEIQLLQNDIKRLGRTTFFEAGDENGDVVKIWLYEDGFPDNHTTRIDTFNVNVKTKVITVDDVAMISGKETITLDEWKKTVKGRFQ